MRNKDIVPFTPELQKLAAKFHCGNDYLDDFIKQPDSIYHLDDKIWVYLTEERDTIIGYYALSTGSLDQIANGHREKIGGSIHVDCFAIDCTFQDRQADNDVLFSDILFSHLLEVCQEVRNAYVGYSFITLESTEAGYKLYSRFNFTELEDDLIFSSQSDQNSSGHKMYFALDEE